MAKLSKIQKNLRIGRTIEKYASIRLELKQKMRDPNITPAERYKAQLDIASLPRDSSPTRLLTRCRACGRPRSVHRKFELDRICLRNLAREGVLPGVVKDS